MHFFPAVFSGQNLQDMHQVFELTSFMSLGMQAASPCFIFTGFQQPVSRRLESCCCWGDEVAEKAEEA